MRYLSVCSGIEAATVAWHPLGWTPVAFAEIEKFPSAVLAHHYPHVPNFGDMTKFGDWPDADVDVLVGGTPCQSFSVAGLRKGMADPRGNLALTYLAIADRYRPEWLLWENVPGVLSSNGGRDFGAILGGMVELGYGFAYRVLDAQYVRVDEFGRAVPQRRRRVFVVGNSRDWRRAAAVLFERESLSWNSPPSRKAGQGFAADAAPSLVSSGRGTERAGDTRGQDPVVAVPAISHCLNAGGMGRLDYETETMVATSLTASRSSTQCPNEDTTLVAHSLRGEGFDASEDGTGRGTPVIPIDMRQASRGGTMTNNRAEGASGGAPGTGIGEDGDPSPTIASSHVPAVGYAIQAGALRENPDSGPDGVGVQIDAAYTLEARAEVQAVAFDMRGREGGAQFEGPHDTANIRAASGGSSRSYVADWAVRRLTPKECERLQGFPDGYTDVPWRNKNWTPDGPRYKAVGNSMAVNAMRWLGTRMQKIADLTPAPIPHGDKAP